jgi:hypothetical protein
MWRGLTASFVALSVVFALPAAAQHAPSRNSGKFLETVPDILKTPPDPLRADPKVLEADPLEALGFGAHTGEGGADAGGPEAAKVHPDYYRLDRNGDGFVSSQEYLGARERSFARTPGNIARMSRSQARRRAVFQGVDRNGDGRLSRDELSGPVDPRF